MMTETREWAPFRAALEELPMEMLERLCSHPAEHFLDPEESLTNWVTVALGRG